MQRIIHLLVVKLGDFILKSFDFLVEKFAPNRDLYESSTVDFDKKLTALQQVLYSEYKAVFFSRLLHNVDEFYKVETNIGQDENWKVYPFILFNNRFENNLNQCPQTKKLLEEIPSCTSAMFSVLYPQKHILPHKGLYKGVIRCLYTLEAPINGSAWIKINGKQQIFKKGEGIYFDETFLHEVKNESEEYRVALYLDIFRELPFPLNILNKLVFYLLKTSPFIVKKVEEYRKLTKTEITSKIQLEGYEFL